MGNWYSGVMNSRYSRELYHHGIKGQKWGVRRFQNADGSLTNAGRERYYGKGNHRPAGESKDSTKDKILKKTLYKDFETDNVDSSKIKNIQDLTPKHDQNKSQVPAFLARVALDTLIPGYQVYLPMDIYRGSKAIAGNIRSNKYSKEREAAPIDKETGFHIKSQELSEKEDLKRVNPDVNDFNSNSKSNCVLCTMTYEMRRRGYDVTANKAGQGYWDREINKFFQDYKVEEIDRPNYRKNFKDKEYDKGSNQFSGGGKQFATRAIDKIIKSQPEGSRGNITVDWGASMGGGAHSMFYEIKNGNLILYDGQIAKIYNDPTKILKMATSVRIGRLDNLKFDKNGIKECCK